MLTNLLTNLVNNYNNFFQQNLFGLVINAIPVGNTEQFNDTFQSSPSLLLGCFDQTGFDEWLRWDTDSMTPDYCVTKCSVAGYPFAGLRDSHSCYCLKNYGDVVSSDCNSPCNG